MLHLHRASHADLLLDALAGVLATPPVDPFAAEVVGVPTRGLERWLAQGLSARLGVGPAGGDGVCANVAFPTPRRMLDDAVAAACGLEPATDPWRPEHAVWPLLRVVDEHLDEPWLAVLAAHLGGTAGAVDPLRRRRRFGSVRHLADLFDRYALHRPAMLAAWRRGEDVDAAGAPLGAAAWQAELWRLLAARIGHDDPATRARDACAALRADPSLADLPGRFACFGLTRLPVGHLDVLDALAADRDVHLLLLHPSPALWTQIAGAPAPAGPLPRAADPTRAIAENRLLASWGRDARELQLVAAGRDHVDHLLDAASSGGAGDEDGPARSLLSRLQADVRADRRPPGVATGDEADLRPPLHPDDRSVQVHACHGRARQVEVLRDAVLHALAEDPTLEPRDVVVLCPDIEAFAPLIQATFGTTEPREDADTEAEPEPASAGPPVLRVRLADRALRQTNPLLGVLARLLELAEGRITASEVLDLADREPVRRRFRLDDDDLARARDWVADGGVRWGLDAEHRRRFRLQDVADGTWRAGLDRLLLGVAMPEAGARRFAGVLPLDDVESGAIDLAGRLAELLHRLGAAARGLADERPVDEWVSVLGEAVDALTAVDGAGAWQRTELLAVLEAVAGEAAAGGGGATPLGGAELRTLLAERLRGRPTRASFRTGHLTVCTLAPMRSVPHRVVCLLGLDDGAFPRRVPHDGDDLVLADPHVGDREGRSEDRQMLLDALLAAGERLIVTYSGSDERTNARRPPAVPVGELLDAAERTVAAPTGEVRDRILLRHPLQPFDPRNFERGALVPERPWGFDRVTAEGAAALAADRRAPAPFLDGPLPAPQEPVVDLADLVRFVEHPTRAFLRDRLGVSVGEHDAEVDDALPIDLDGLEQWAIGQRLVEALLTGTSPEACLAAERARGGLPPGELARPTLELVLRRAERIVAAAGPGDTPGGSLDVRVALPDGRPLGGTVAGVHGDLLRVVAYSRVGPRHRLAAWVRLLALTAARPRRAFAAATVGRSGVRGADVMIARLPPLAADPDARRARALEGLQRLVDLRDRGMREALPIACRTSAAYAAEAARGGDAASAAAGPWQGSCAFPGEDRDPEHVLVHGGSPAFSELLAEAPRSAESGPGWADGEATRFGRLARRLWEPVLDHERTEHR